MLSGLLLLLRQGGRPPLREPGARRGPRLANRPGWPKWSREEYALKAHVATDRAHYRGGLSYFNRRPCTEVKRSGKLRVGHYNQHSEAVLELEATPLQFLKDLYPEARFEIRSHPVV